MNNLRPLTFTLVILVLSLVLQASDTPEKLPKYAFTDIIWDDLLPEDLDLSTMYSAPIDHSLSAENPVQSQSLRNNVLDTVVADLDGEPIRIPGFIVPLEFDDDLVITEFFLVPYFGACTHSPPPPPNQIIFVKDPVGFTLDDLYTPFWVSGIVSTTLVENELAASGYSINMQYLEEYTDW